MNSSMKSMMKRNVTVFGLIHMENGKFANYMREHGQKCELVSAEHQHQEESYQETGQVFVTREQMLMWHK